MNYMNVFLGIFIGAIFILVVSESKIGRYVSKDKLKAKEAIYMTDHYAQYSAVRRFK